MAVYGCKFDGRLFCRFVLLRFRLDLIMSSFKLDLRQYLIKADLAFWL